MAGGASELSLYDFKDKLEERYNLAFTHGEIIVPIKKALGIVPSMLNFDEFQSIMMPKNEEFAIYLVRKNSEPLT